MQINLNRLVYFGMLLLFVITATGTGLGDPVNLEYVGRCNYQSWPMDLVVSGNYAYVADELNGLDIVDISNPTKPTLTGSYVTTGWTYGVAVSGNYVYVADADKGLFIADISNPLLPNFVGSYDSYDANSIAVSGNYAYIGSWNNGLLIVDISNPTAPKLVGRYAMKDNYPLDFVIVGKYAYLVDAEDSLMIFDVNNPSSPKLVGSYDTFSWPMDLAVSGNYAYVLDYVNGLLIMDISNPTAPKLVGSYDINGGALSVAVLGNYAYVTTDYNGLAIVDVSNPTAPTLIDSYVDTGKTRGVDISGNYVCVGDSDNGLIILRVDTGEQDTTPPASVTNLGETDVGPSFIGWSWTNPTDADFSHVMVYIDGVFVTTTSEEYYSSTTFAEGTTHTIGLKTVDTSGNVNPTMVSDSATTLLWSDNEPSPAITGVVIEPLTGIYEGDTATIKVSVTNNGMPSDNGYISVSFPNNEEIEVSGTGVENKIYPVGSTLYTETGTIVSVDPLAELTETSWVPGQTETLTIKVKPNAGSSKIEFYVRAALQADTGLYIRTPVTSADRDQQGWYANKYTINVYQRPNLVISDIMVDGNTIYYEIKNTGPITAGSSDSYLYINDMTNSVASDYVASLGPGESRTESFSYNYNFAGGTDTIKVVADAKGVINEGNEGDNERTESYNGQSQQSMNVAILSPQDAFVVNLGDTQTIKTKISDNLGNSIPGSSVSRVQATFSNGDEPILLFDDGNHNDDLAEDGIYAGEWKVSTADALISETPITVTVEASHSSLSPSQSSVTGTIKYPDLAINIVSWTPNDYHPKNGETIEFTVEVENKGSQDANGFSINYYIGNVETFSSTAPQIPAGQKYADKFTWTVNQGGDVEVKAYADASNIFLENNETNNEAIATVNDPIEKYALIIGINEYDETATQDLSYCVNDAESIYNLLTLGYGYDEKNIEKLLDEQATQTEIHKKFDDLYKKVDSNDIFVFYFSGHGSRNDDGIEYICPVDWNSPGRVNDLTNYELQLIFDKFDGNARIIAIFDSCHSGAMSYLTDIDDPQYTKNGIYRDSTVVLMASNVTELSHENPTIKHGFFTYSLFEAFTSGRVDMGKSSEDLLSMEEAFNYAAPKTTEFAKKEGALQHPQIMDAYPSRTSNSAFCYFANEPIDSEFLTGILDCPAHLHAYDSTGRHTGLDDVDGFEEEIPGSVYNGPEYDPEEIIILNQSENITYKIDSFGEGVFNFTIRQSDDSGIVEVEYLNIPIKNDSVAVVEVKPENQNYVMQIDFDNDGTFENTAMPDSIKKISNSKDDSKSGGDGGSSSSSKSSSGGGGGGAGSAEDYSNVAVKDVDTQYLRMNANVTYEFTKEGNPIQSVSLYSLKNSGEITSTIEVLNNRSKLVNSTPEGSIYKYVNIWVGKSGFATAANIKDAKVKFKVNDSWLQDMALNPADVKLQRYNGTAWEILSTTIESNATGYVIFEAQTPGFSPFAITAEKALSSPTSSVTETESHATGSDVGLEKTQSEKSSIWTVGIGILLIGVCAAGYMYMKKR